MPIPASAAIHLRDKFVQSLTMESQTTIKVFKEIPDAKWDYKPHAKSMAFGELAWHTASAERFFVHSLLAGKFEMGAPIPGVPKEGPKSSGALVLAYEQLTKNNITDLKEADGEKLGKDIAFFNIMTLPAITYMQLALNHSIHHRGQLSVYLRLVDAKVPSIYGPSADDNPFKDMK